MFDFFNPEGSKGQSITIIGVSWQYWLAVFISVFSIGLLFVCKKSYARMANKRYLMVGLGIIQLFLFFIYYILHFIYLYGFKLQSENLRGWTWILPLHLSSITQLLSAYLLIKPNTKLFSITAPWVVILVFASIIIPADKSYGPQHFSYWSYYALHIIIIFTYWYLYMYGFVKYERKYLLWSFLSLLIFSLIALTWNGISISIARIPQEITNMLFIGLKGYPLWGSISTSTIWTGGKNTNLWFLGYFPIAIFGLFFVGLGHLVISRVQPYYMLENKQLLALARQKQKFDFKAFKDMWHDFKTIFY